MGKKSAHQAKQLKRFSLLSKAIFILTSIWILSVSVAGLIFFLLSMVPALVAALNDKGSGKCASKTVGAFNYMGVLPSLFHIWHSPDATIAARTMLVDPNVWLITYGSAASGWMMVLLMPKVVSYIFTSRSTIKIRHIESLQKELINEWGPSVTGEPIEK